LSQRTNFLWREATATIHTFWGERTISTKVKLVARNSYLNKMTVCCDKLLRQYIVSSQQPSATN
jgi:hypothetical protein